MEAVEDISSIYPELISVHFTLVSLKSSPLSGDKQNKNDAESCCAQPQCERLWYISSKQCKSCARTMLYF